MGNNFVLKIKLENIEPEIYRIISVRKNFTFFDLHQIIQLAFNWDDYHLYEFELTNGVRIISEDEYEVQFEIPPYIIKKQYIDKKQN
ncbi:IS1096 element passenger TnpR family protein [Marinitoga lauensis]|uniref:IS1096 element passenger TnpR family protein n=1 Tax=Marinitoga lauensis TaxID=2201189 RepID=UPI00101059F1|nr:hypothetical protein [Marinitoga lauensis]